MNLKRIRLILLAVILVIVSGGAGFGVGRNRTLKTISETKGGREVDLSLMWEVWDDLEDNYLFGEKVDSQKMILGAIEGMTNALDDPYTSFLPPQENNRSKEDLSGEFGGVGIQLGYIDKTLAVMAPLVDHPAIEQGILAGDLILRIKDEEKGVDTDTVGMSLTEAVNNIRGEKGKPVTLTIYHDGADDTEEITIVRDIILIPSVELSWVGSNEKVAWLRLMRFGEKTLPEWNKAIDEIVLKGADGVIVDFRNNPGGYLQRAIDLVSEFVPSGVVVQQRGKNETKTFSVNRRGRLLGIPTVAMVNRGSASASEIMAGAMRETVGIKLVGEKTFGKGTVQEVYEFAEGAGLHITVAEWLLPSGKNIHGDGLVPDVEISDDRETEEDEQLLKAVEVVKEVKVNQVAEK